LPCRKADGGDDGGGDEIEIDFFECDGCAEEEDEATAAICEIGMDGSLAASAAKNDTGGLRALCGAADNFKVIAAADAVAAAIAFLRIACFECDDGGDKRVAKAADDADAAAAECAPCAALGGDSAQRINAGFDADDEDADDTDDAYEDIDADVEWCGDAKGLAAYDELEVDNDNGSDDSDADCEFCE
jgi:hypothetical protein